MPNDPQSVPPAAAPPPAAAAPSAPAAAPGKQGVSRIARTVVLVLLVVFVYHLFADRITPYTSQATIGTFLVQMAPQVSGQVVAVDVRDNQLVRKGQSLFQWSMTPMAGELEPGESVAFSTQLAKPPEDAVSVRLGFVDGRRLVLRLAGSECQYGGDKGQALHLHSP